MGNQKTNGNDLTNFKVRDLVYRVEGAETGDYITYDEKKCDSCGMCALVCSINMWAVPNGKKARLSPKYKELCLECAACYAVCEQDAIYYRYPNGGSGIIIKHG